MKKKKLLPIFQDKVSLHRAFLSKNGKNLNKSFLAFYNSLKSESKKEQGIKAIRNKQESISGFITKSGNFRIKLNSKDKDNNGAVSNASYWVNQTKEVEKNVEEFHLQSMKQYAEEKRNEIINENRKVKTKNYLKVNYSGVRKHTPLVSFGKSKRRLDWLEPKNREDECGISFEDKWSSSLRFIPSNQQRRYKDKVRRRRDERISRSMNLNLIKLDPPTKMFQPSSLLDIAFQSEEDSPSLNSHKREWRVKKKDRKGERLSFVKISRYKESLTNKKRIRSLNREVNMYRKKRAKRMFKRIDRKYKGCNEEKNDTSLDNSNLVELFKKSQEQTEKEMTEPAQPVKQKKEFSHLFFKKMKRRRKKDNKSIETKLELI